jgi:hypothetical protein
MRAYATRLEDWDHRITSAWLYRGDVNVEELLGDEAMFRICTTCSGPIGLLVSASRARGNSRRLIGVAELGAALGAGKKIFVIGGPEHVFRAHPAVTIYRTFSDLDRVLKRERRAMRVAA